MTVCLANVIVVIVLVVCYIYMPNFFNIKIVIILAGTCALSYLLIYTNLGSRLLYPNYIQDIKGGAIVGTPNIELKYEINLPESDIEVIWNRTDLQVNDVLKDMYKNQAVYDKGGRKIKYNSGVGPVEGWHLYKLVLKNNCSQILEIGMAYGTSALYMCQALKELDNKKNSRQLTSIDPFQSTQWKGIGVLNIERAKLADYHSLIEKTSDDALPELLKQKKTYDMIFIDGMHLFDYTLVDIYYAAKLIRINGIIVIDDIRHKGVKKAIEYIKKNYNFLYYVENTVSSSTMGTFVKINDDTRNWDFHIDF